MAFDWKYATSVFMIFLTVFGSGVSLGRYIPAQQGEESVALRSRLADVCAGEVSIQSNRLCQTVFAANRKLYHPPISSQESQLQKDAQFLDWLSGTISDPSNTRLGTCSLSQLEDFQTCPSSSSTLSQIQPRNLPGVPPQSRTWRIMSTVGIFSVYVWKLAIFLIPSTYIIKAAGPRYVFALWASIPSIWFLKHAPSYVVWVWYLLSSAATADLRFSIPLPRSWIFFYLCGLSAIVIVWQIVKSSREISFYMVLFFAVVVPLEPAFEFIISQIPKTWFIREP